MSPGIRQERGALANALDRCSPIGDPTAPKVGDAQRRPDGSERHEKPVWEPSERHVHAPPSIDYATSGARASDVSCQRERAFSVLSHPSAPDDDSESLPFYRNISPSKLGREMPHRIGIGPRLPSTPGRSIMKLRTVLRLSFVLAGVSILASCAATDVGITSAVKAKLIADEAIKSSQIEVSTKDGVVTLTGNVDSAEVKAKALDLARATTGVKQVVDMISFRQASGSGDAPEPSRTLGDTVTDA